ncbi:UbiA family prenyltransferase [Streptomyces sp. H27-D2]|uniref:UbiA family prenyltransferase n=1 Tax=Streptomyces sp. H27-D2 TaxID=3046304 RepID=UPI002DBC109D|nr:UbiA family prenyltransferase [Streptomyces sp. H27-D2]MEC4015031.1 UbiA family prenyltransferase [Streptomyces sp. H27-D2]
MNTETTSSRTGRGDRAERSGWETTRAFVRLSKATVYQHFFPWALALALLDTAALGRSGAAVALALFLVASAAIVACTSAVDDVIGFRNGSDSMNYQEGDLGRDIRRKPLLSGAITERQAQIFAAVTGAAALVTGLGGFAVLGWDVPAESVVIFLVVTACSVQYSGGFRFSFRTGGSESMLGLVTAGGLIFPYLALAQRWSTAAVLEALLMGLWLVMVISYSNVNDKDGDAAVGRRTLAVVSGPKVFKSAMVTFFIVDVGLLAAFVALPSVPWWAALTLLPAAGLHIAQLWFGVGQENWLKARLCGFIGYDLGFLGLLVPTLFIG